MSYADFFLVANLHFCVIVDADIFERMASIVPEFGNLYTACGEWLVRDS